MRKDQKGQPRDPNKQKGVRIKPVMPAENLERDDEAREKYTRDQDKPAENVKEGHPGTNRNKGESTNAGSSRQ